ncbi:hypothetical protein RE476_03345 [Methanolobus mangrovi]|uniref:Uncharacterized protein n=1 Tax=Methanolobus mangrovi TaxID=3072977 RepID=A0AA51UGJ5_9EURY|nr:hypothetical protein [Methanolobus mangrovi]WMW22872.1 hypothetical protein RE476_03345 [Methanolobus mangrovi]
MNFSRKLIITASAIILLLLSFAFLDIGVKSSITNAESTTSAYSSGETENLLSIDIILYLDQENGFDTMVEKQLITTFEETGYSVTLTDEIKDDYSSQFVFVNVIDMNMFYTPLYSKSYVDVMFGFSSTGKTKYLDIEGSGDRKAVVFSSEDEDDYQFLAQGDVTLYDETKGIFTYNSYQNHIAREIARSVASELDSQLKTRN